VFNRGVVSPSDSLLDIYFLSRGSPEPKHPPCAVSSI
jgi:hypothetical protein